MKTATFAPGRSILSMPFRPFVLILSFLVGLWIPASAQDIKLYKGPGFTGDSLYLNIGDTLFLGAIASISFVKYTAEAALIVEAVDPVPTDVENWQGFYSKMFYYSDEWKRSGIIGTDQYGKIPVRARCIRKDLPQPDIYVPIDAGKVHPEASPFPYPVQKKSMLYLKRGFFWENSEDLRCDLDPGGPYSPHGPAGDVKLNICHKSAAGYSLDSLDYFQQLWDIGNNPGCSVRFVFNGKDPVKIISDCASRMIDYKPQNLIDFFGFDYSGPFDTTVFLPRTFYHGTTLFGPVYLSPPACDAAGVAYAPVAHNEWTDGPWGTTYSNVAVLDWDSIPDDEVTIVVAEADKPFDYIVASSSNLADVMGAKKVSKTDTSDILINLGTCGWIILKNEESDGRTAEYVDHYWYPAWDGQSPELTLGSPGPAKHFELENYFCDDVGSECAPLYNDIIKTAKVWKTYIDLEQMDTFRVYWFNSCPFSMITPDTIYAGGKRSDSLYSAIGLFSDPCAIIDTQIISPANLYRRWGSQYQPYYSYEQVKKFVPDKDSIGIYGGLIPASHTLKKQMTLLPLDEELAGHKKAFREYAQNADQNRSVNDDPLKLLTSNCCHLYPNPASDAVSIVFNHTGHQFVHIAVYTATGDFIMELNGGSPSAGEPESYRLSLPAALPDGVYFVKIDTDRDASALKFVKRR